MIFDLIATPPKWVLALPPPLGDVLQTLLSPTVLGALAIGSIAMFVLSAAGLPWFLARVPADYFSSRELKNLGLERPHRAWWRRGLVVLRNAVGVVLLLAGVAMLLLPGQGLLTIFAALFLLDFPGKRRLQRRLVQNEAVFRGLNALRRRMGAAPFDR